VISGYKYQIPELVDVTAALKTGIRPLNEIFNQKKI
jgi:hypothetical protein